MTAAIAIIWSQESLPTPPTILHPEHGQRAHDASISLFESIMCPGCRFVLTVTWALDGIQNEIGSQRPLSTFGGFFVAGAALLAPGTRLGAPGGLRASGNGRHRLYRSAAAR